MYNTIMNKVPNIEWNQNQLKIALELSKGKKPKEIFAEGQFTETLIYKVAKAIDGGNKPPSLDEAYIASAPPPTPFGTGKKQKVKTGEVAPAKLDTVSLTKGEQITDEIAEASVLRLIPKVQSLPLTPDIFIGFMCAVARGFPGDIGDWLSLASRDFWYGRGVNPYQEVSGIGNEKATGVAK